MDALKQFFRERLLASGFLEGTKKPGNFYKPQEPDTAFFVNFKDRGDRLGICYGLASTAFTRMSACENVLTEYGILNEEACVRFFLYLKEPEDVETAEGIIREKLAPYAGMGKDELLSLVRDRRKQFLNSIHSVLKSAGFKRKGSRWTRPYSDDYLLHFLADKSAFCDSYRFVVTIESNRKKYQNYSWCSNFAYNPAWEDAYDPESAFRFDWQLNTREELMKLLQDFLREYVEPVNRGGMDALGKQEYIRKRCGCKRDCCDGCWIGE